MATDNNISRRNFFGLAGGAAAAAAIAGVGLNSGWGQNETVIEDSNTEHSDVTIDVLVIGGGMAGLFAAVKAHDAGAKVMLVSKGGIGTSGQTPFAKGMFEFDPKTSGYTMDEFLSAVNVSARGTNNSVYTRQMAEHSAARLAELRQWGFFDEALCKNSFLRPIKERGILVKERIVITHLLKEQGQMAGAAGFSLDENRSFIFNAKSVILCTGAGGFKPNGFPICDLTHDGTVMAYQIGAKVTGKEWNDGHPGQATNAAACFDGWNDMFEKVPSVTSVSVRHDLGVELNYAAYVKGGPVSMMGSNAVEGGPSRPAMMTSMGNQQGGHEGPGGRPSGDSRGDRPKGPPPGGKHPGGGKNDGPPSGGMHPGGGKEGGGAPPGMGGVTVGGSSAGMAIHKSEGLVPINDQCESNIKGLYAAGDALGSYMAGAIYTQIGSSLTGSAVQGAVAGEAAANYSANKRRLAISTAQEARVKDEIFAPMKRESGYSAAYVTQTLQGIMIPNFVLYIKKARMMEAALAYIEELRDHHMPMMRAANMHELRLVHETQNMILSAEMKLKASLMRTESRCSHYRLDYPEVDDVNWRAWINIYKGKDGIMQFEKQAFTSVL